MNSDVEPVQSSGRGQASRVVLVAEDDPSVRVMLASLLGHDGWEVHATDTGRNVPDLIDEFGPVLCLLDVMMPGADGVEAMEEARARGHGPDDGTVFIMLTALDGGESMQRAVFSGADDYITKPFDIDDLGDRLVRWCIEAGWELVAPANPGLVYDHLEFQGG